MNNLKLPQVAPNQNQKEVTINDQVIALDAALTESYSVDLSSSDVVLDDTDFTRSAIYACSGATSGSLLTVPDDIKRVFVVRNTSGEAVSVKAGSGGTSVSVASGVTATLYSDGAGDLWNIGGGGIPEAPTDGVAYSRKNGDWVDSGLGDIALALDAINGEEV